MKLKIFLLISLLYFSFGEKLLAQDISLKIGASYSCNFVFADKWNEGLYDVSLLFDPALISRHRINPSFTIPYSGRYSLLLDLPISKRSGLVFMPSIIHHHFKHLESYIGVSSSNAYLFSLQIDPYWKFKVDEHSTFRTGLGVGVAANMGKIQLFGGLIEEFSGNSTNGDLYHESTLWSIAYKKNYFLFIEPSLAWETAFKGDKNRLLFKTSLHVPVQKTYYYTADKEYYINNNTPNRFTMDGNTFRSIFLSFSVTYMRAL